MLFLISWLVFGLIVGYFAKVLHPGDEPVGWIPTLAIGVAGSFVGGTINFLLGMGSHPFQASCNQTPRYQLISHLTGRAPL
jgi:uncharacterized membrane protein YeaQ/YmgE (transglycosylase-associated protein family)